MTAEPTEEDRRPAEYWGLSPEHVASMPKHAPDCTLVTTHHLTCSCGAFTKRRSVDPGRRDNQASDERGTQ